MSRRREPVIPDAILDQLLVGAAAKTAFDPRRAGRGDRSPFACSVARRSGRRLRGRRRGLRARHDKNITRTYGREKVVGAWAPALATEAEGADAGAAPFTRARSALRAETLTVARSIPARS